MSNSNNSDQEGQNFVPNNEESGPDFNTDEDFEQPLPELPVHACSNCGSDLNGHFCAICGQPNKEIRRPIFVLLAEVLHVLLDLDGRAYRSIFFLFTRPAFLSTAYINGQRANYTAPLRLFLAISITFFIFISAQNTFESLRDSMNAVANEQNSTQDISPEQDADEENGSTLPRYPGEEFANFDYDDGENLDGLMPLIGSINIPFVSEQTNSNLHAVMRQQALENYAAVVDDPGEAVRGLLEYITVFILLMIPILAFMQYIFYFFAKRYFIEHLVLTLHNNTFVVFAFLLLSLLGLVESSNLAVINSIAGVLNTLIVIWIPIYLFLSLKFFFGWGWLVTTLLYFVTSIAYAIAMGLGIAAFALALFVLS